MGSLLVVAAVAALVFAWVRATRRNRQLWLERLDLPGTWDWDEHEGSLEISGDLSGGRYRFREPNGNESGRWVLEGHQILLSRTADRSVAYDLRFFDKGKIGLDGPGRERRVYTKLPSNVVPLRRNG